MLKTLLLRQAFKGAAPWIKREVVLPLSRRLVGYAASAFAGIGYALAPEAVAEFEAAIIVLFGFIVDGVLSYVDRNKRGM